MNYTRAAQILLAIILFTPMETISTEKLGDRLQQRLELLQPTDPVHVWIYFTDKGRHEALRHSVPTTVVTERALQRRAKNRLPQQDLVDYSDLPVEEAYVSLAASRGLTVRHRSRWFNSISGVTTKEHLDAIALLECVRTIELVALFESDEREKTFDQAPVNGPAQPRSTHSLDYGASFGQVSQINVPIIHDQGNYGQGVMVGVFDNGFRLLTHQAFDSMIIAATYDFVDHKVSVVPNNPSHGGHGVNTLSTVGGYRPGQLIGPAFGATFLLARTENDSSETPVEEDNWVAAIEWAESLGVDVTSTSLSYLTYDLPYTSWTWQDMDGNTTVITRASDMAVARGVLVVNSASNSGFNATQNTLGAPADGDSVLTVGSVTSAGVRSSFSSVGPTTSTPPRIKPDVMAQGSSVRVASSVNPTSYGSSSGTSFSCPLAAGAAALIVKARPQATAVEVMDAMRNTASRASTPDNLYGWGIINTLAAINYLSPSSAGPEPVLPQRIQLEQNYPNPFNPTTSIRFALPAGVSGTTSIRVYDILGTEIALLLHEEKSVGVYSVNWDGRNKRGDIVGSGLYFYRLSVETSSGVLTAVPKKMAFVR